MRRARRLALAGLMVLPLAAGAIAVFFWRGNVLANKAIEQLRTAGEPVTPAEMEVRYRAGVTNNRTTEWQQALLELRQALPPGSPDEVRLLVDFPKGSQEPNGRFPRPGEPWPSLDEVEPILARCRPALDAFVAVSAAPGAVRMPLDFKTMFTMKLGHIDELRHAQRMLTLALHVDLYRQRDQQAEELLDAMHHTARGCQAEPTLVSYLSRIAIEGMCSAAVESTVTQLALDDAQLRVWQEFWRQSDYRAQLQAALQVERIMFLRIPDAVKTSGIDEIGSVCGDGQVSLPIRSLWAFRATRGYDQLLGLSFLDECLKAATLPLPKARAIVDAADQELKGSINRASDYLYATTYLFLPAIARMNDQRGRAECRAALMSVAIAIERYRRSEGLLPTAINDIVPRFIERLPSDPWGNAPPRYRVDPTEFVVWYSGTDDSDHEPAGVVRVALP